MDQQLQKFIGCVRVVMSVFDDAGLASAAERKGAMDLASELWRKGHGSIQAMRRLAADGGLAAVCEGLSTPLPKSSTAALVGFLGCGQRRQAESGPAPARGGRKAAALQREQALRREIEDLRRERAELMLAVEEEDTLYREMEEQLAAEQAQLSALRAAAAVQQPFGWRSPGRTVRCSDGESEHGLTASELPSEWGTVDPSLPASVLQYDDDDFDEDFDFDEGGDAAVRTVRSAPVSPRARDMQCAQGDVWETMTAF
eukprot:TRINITY_DN87_c4_g1_i2.p1 TRINITY_DN87_c4_g1~~TRINITY_DN87_c4_g1_i2.p1  ORF type:complete len:257 (+),score=97.88 TRINITY_DN87_c4_g1_i2:78-848(+)